MSETVLDKKTTLKKLLPEYKSGTPGMLEQICLKVDKSQEKIVVLDDDPTGTQTVHGIPVLTTWDRVSLKKEMKNSENAFFILTNSRGLTRDAARHLGFEIGANLKQVSEECRIPVSVISRSDSTLRGHFPEEVDETALAMGESGLPYLICPFFLEGGRYTIDNTHYVEEGDDLVPAAQTSYAKDAAFGFENSDLCRWVQEKTRGRIPADQVICVSLDHIRKGGPSRVCDELKTVPDNGACIVNAASYTDMEVFVTGLLEAGKAGKRFLYRTAASFVRVRAGVVPRSDLVSQKELSHGTAAGGLFIVGSYVPKTSAQVTALMAQTDIFPIEIRVKKVLDMKSREQEIERVITELNAALSSGKDTLVYTSRGLVRSDDPDESLEIGQAVSSSLIRIVQNIQCRPRYLVAKGGITSSDVATKGLGVKRAMVLGQALPGVPVWQLGDEALYPGMSYIIFPGNVGDDNALADIKNRLRRRED